jgi:hypothetical protein
MYEVSSSTIEDRCKFLREYRYFSTKLHGVTSQDREDLEMYTLSLFLEWNEWGLVKVVLPSIFLQMQAALTMVHIFKVNIITALKLYKHFYTTST